MLHFLMFAKNSESIFECNVVKVDKNLFGRLGKKGSE